MSDGRIEVVTRAAAAGVLRMQAAAMRAQGELLRSMARTTDEQADAIEQGTDDWPTRPAKLAIVPLDDNDDEESEFVAQGGAGQAIKPLDPDRPGRYIMASGGYLTEGMRTLLDRFDDRLLTSPNFATAVNEAVEHALAINDNTAQAIASRVRELDEAGQGANDG